MPKKIKAIPNDRAEWSFGDALYWHFFIHGTRPEGSPQDRTGVIWDPKQAAGAVGVGVRAFWNWIDDRHFPYDTANIERALFGESSQFDEWRDELRRLLRGGRAALAKTPPTSTGLPSLVTGQAVTLYDTPFEAAEVEGPLRPEDFGASASENFGKPDKNDASGGVLASHQAGRGDETQPGVARPVRSSRTMTVAICAAILAVLTLYGAKRFYEDLTTRREVANSQPTATTGTPVVKTDTPAKGPTADLPDISAKPQTDADPRATEKKRQDDRKAAAQKKQLDDLEAARQQKLKDATDFNAKLKTMAKGDADDLCKQKIQGLSVPGFTLKCDVLIPFGKLLGAVPVSQTASSLGDCASRCRRVPECVAFTFDAAGHEGARSCYLTGSIPGENPARNWIAGIRR